MELLSEVLWVIVANIIAFVAAILILLILYRYKRRKQLKVCRSCGIKLTSLNKDRNRCIPCTVVEEAIKNQLV